MSRSPEHDARNFALQARFSNLDNARAGAIPDAITIPNRAKLLGLQHEVQDVPESDGARIHWLGDKSADKVIVYYHGGGYGLPAFDGHVILLAQSAEKMARKGHKTVIALLEYGLTKTKKYPTQFIQAIECLRVVVEAGYPPRNIIVGGDSAGGNMALAVMSILLHPHPDVRPLKIQEPLGGLLLVCAWVGFKSDSKSYDENTSRDIHMKAQMHEWADDFCTMEERNNYTEPVDADPSWFRGFPARKTLNIFGGYEIFRDDIARMGKLLREAGADVEDVLCPLQVHIDSVLDAQTGLEIGPMTTEMWRWLENVFD